MQVTIDEHSGFCFGVVNAIRKAEDELNLVGKLYCLGKIVHNQEEVNRLEKLGLETISYEQLKELKNCTVLIRAHGEPPETYDIAKRNNIQLIDATCPVVLKLQSRIKKSFEEMGENGQVVIFGKKGHAEVNGLVGQTSGKALVVHELADLSKIDPSKSVALFSQTTMGISEFQEIEKGIQGRYCDEEERKKVKMNDTICRQVANRAPHLREFASNNDVILFVSGKESSNGKVLFNVCKEINPKSYFISNVLEIEEKWFNENDKVGICGATSTPGWLMQEVANYLSTLFKS